MSTPRVRANGQGSLFSYRNGYAAYVWVTTPVGGRERKWIYESVRRDDNALYAAYVLILVLGLRKGEVLGLTWPDVDLDAAELTIGRQLQRVRGELLHRETKTEASDATLPLPPVCVTALRQRRAVQDRARETAGATWT